MARYNVPLKPQKQVDQAIKNFILNPAKKEKIRFNLMGGTSIVFEAYVDHVRAYRSFKQTWIFLGYYYSEDLETDPEIDYQIPPKPYFTYDEIIKRAEEVRRYGAPLEDGDLSKLTDVNLTRSTQRIGRPKVKRPLLEPASASPSNPLSIEVTEKKETVSASPKTNANDDLKESLNRRLRLLDLKIEREEILNQLAAL